jgi:hypothetical protein
LALFLDTGCGYSSVTRYFHLATVRVPESLRNGLPARPSPEGPFTAHNRTVAEMWLKLLYFDVVLW